MWQKFYQNVHLEASPENKAFGSQAFPVPHLWQLVSEQFKPESSH
jgi:hypothetical protein